MYTLNMYILSYISYVYFIVCHLNVKDEKLRRIKSLCTSKLNPGILVRFSSFPLFGLELQPYASICCQGKVR